ncbi:MAG: SufD family Fe-S cluster assembly protein [Clostridiales bacterium]|nr:SufD family Fe-S cluster assembly protein [Clostridiales bacterium]
MQVNLKEFNILPAKTWRWIGVNGGEIDFTVPSIRPYKFQAFTGQVPDGAEVYNIFKDGIVFMDDETDPTIAPEIVKFMRASHNSGYFIHIASGKRIEEPIVFDYNVGLNAPSVLDDNIVIAEEGSDATVVLHYASQEQIKGFHFGMTKLIAKKDAHIKLVLVQMLGESCQQFDTVGAFAFEGGRIEVIASELGGKRAFLNCKTCLSGPKSAFDMGVVYFGDGERKIDIGIVAEHKGKNTESKIEAHGALLDSSEKIFRGTIDFKRGSSGSKGREEETTMLLGQHVRNRTAPLILCAEEDVDGRHAASIGHVDEDRLFYLMSRGLNESEARKMLIEAAFSPVVTRIPVPAFRQEISDYLIERLNKIEKI